MLFYISISCVLKHFVVFICEKRYKSILLAQLLWAGAAILPSALGHGEVCSCSTFKRSRASQEADNRTVSLQDDEVELEARESE